jgi:hypothetical protein
MQFLIVICEKNHICAAAFNFDLGKLGVNQFLHSPDFYTVKFGHNLPKQRSGVLLDYVFCVICVIGNFYVQGASPSFNY